MCGLSEERSPVWYIWLEMQESHRVRQFAQMVAILGQHSNKNGMSVSLCVRLFLCQRMQTQIKGQGVKVFK